MPYINIRSRHKSHDTIRRTERLPFRSVVRFGSTTTLEAIYRKNKTKINLSNIVECNSIEGVKNSANKFHMKVKFFRGDVTKTANWYTTSDGITFTNQIPDILKLSIDKLNYPIVAKHIYGSRGEGNFKLNTTQELTDWLIGKNTHHYIFEEFYAYLREYRLHVTADGCFYACRKMLKQDTPEDKRWFRNDSNSVWILEENPLFDKPVNWDEIVAESVKALNAVGLDIGAIDVKVQSAKDGDGNIRKNPDFIILETNSAPSFGDITKEKYQIEIPKILRKKYENK